MVIVMLVRPPILSERLRLSPSRQTRCCRKFQAFTLVEMLVVVAIVGLLAALLFPMFERLRGGSLKTQSTNNLRQLAIATRLYAGDNNNLPPYGQAAGNVVWQMAIASYLNYLPPGAPAGSSPTTPNLWQSLHKKRPEGVWRNPAASAEIRSGNYSDYGINYRLSGHYETHGRYSFLNVSNPSEVFLYAEVGNCDRGIRDGWAAILPFHDNDSTALAVYVDGRVGSLTSKEVEEAISQKGQNDYPWGWEGRANQTSQKN